MRGKGAEEAYRCTARLFAQQQEPQAASHCETPAVAPAHGQAVRGPTSDGGGGGRGAAKSIGQETREDDTSASLRTGRMEGQEPEGRRGTVATDFLDFDVASPQVRL